MDDQLLSFPPLDTSSVLMILFVVCATLVAGYVGTMWLRPKEAPESEQEPKRVDPRDFTLEQLSELNGLENKPVYVSLNREVFDVTQASDFYGVDGPYHLFAGHDASRCLAKLSFEQADLDGSTEDLNAMERDSLNTWYQKFKYFRGYPVVGRVVTPPEPRTFTLEELKRYDGTNEVPEGRINAPVYVAVEGKVFDVSFGGFQFYSPGGTYHIFAGKDASRALAKMSFKEEDVNSTDVSELTEEEKKVMRDWAFKFERVKKYPVVGHLSV